MNLPNHSESSPKIFYVFNPLIKDFQPMAFRQQKVEPNTENTNEST